MGSELLRCEPRTRGCQPFGDLGQRTDDLRDIIDCVELATGRTLDFAKQKSAAWQRNLPRFVNELGGSRKLEP